ncbi:hypothetical protein Tco_0805700, partial [Tanacetum coccineum]
KNGGKTSGDAPKNLLLLELVFLLFKSGNIPMDGMAADTNDEDEEIDEHNEPRYPVRTNRGVPKKRYQADLKAKSKYPICNYVSNHRLANSHALGVEKLSTVSIPSDVQEAMKDEKWKKSNE